jgi:hypothetical protein
VAEINLQVVDPAEITLPLNVQQLAFMNRSVAPGLLDKDSVWTQEEYYILDTIVNNWVFSGLRETLAESPLFDMAEIRIIRVRRMDTVGLLEPLDSIALRKIKDEHPSDALISLEHYNIDDSVHVRFNLEHYLYESYMGFRTTTVWRIYDLVQENVFDECILRDTVGWDGWHESEDLALKELPLAIDAIRSAAYYAGKNYGNRISPAWKNVHRYYYISGGKQMRDAGRLAVTGDWDAASVTWTELAQGEDLKTAAKACFNMALICEMDDRLVPALDWAVKSYSLRQEKLTREYIDLLKQRYEDLKKLRLQLPSGE